MTTVDDTWSELTARMRGFADLSNVNALLGWDQETYMPLRGSDARARQMATMRVIRHEMLVNPRLGELLDRVGDEPLDRPRREMVRLLRRDLVEVIELPRHPFYVASQFHPEFKSRPTRPSPLFRDFVGAAVERLRTRAGSLAAPAG